MPGGRFSIERIRTKPLVFTGIVQEIGKIEAIDETATGVTLAVSAPNTCADAAIGDSIAVDGCCVTVVRVEGNILWFDLLAETVRVSVFSSRRPGDAVNLESSLRLNGKIGGHFVTGHIDGVGQVALFEPREKDHYLEVKSRPEWSRYLVPKGSVAVNGVSLTVAESGDHHFSVWIIPHTLEMTNLGQVRRGDPLNLEFDLLGKYVEKLLPNQTAHE